MKRTQFRIGKTFWMSGKQYRCTDIGTRNVLAVHLCYGKRIPVIISTRAGKKRIEKRVYQICDKKYFKLPPECLDQQIIFACEFDACQATKTAFQAELERARATPAYRRRMRKDRLALQRALRGGYRPRE